MLERLHTAFQQAGEPSPELRFVLSESGLENAVSGVDRVLKRFPGMHRFLSTVDAFLGQPAYRVLSNESDTPAANEALDFEHMLRIAEGVPQSFPFHNIVIRFNSPQFGALPAGMKPPMAMLAHGLQPGVVVGDAWSAGGRMRSLKALAIVDAPASGKTLPPLPDVVQAVFAACGKPHKVNQVALGESEAQLSTPAGPSPASTAPRSPANIQQKVAALVSEYRERMPALVERNPLPHRLPPLAEALQLSLGKKPGEKKPALMAAFRPLGFRIRGGSGDFTLSRRTPTNLTVELTIDVGTWSNLASARYAVLGPGFSAGLPLPITSSAMDAIQYPIGDAAQWAKIVANLATLTQTLDATFLADIEALTGQAGTA